jgi:integrase
MHRKANRHGGAVVVRTSKSGVKTFSLKWVDAAGEQAWERLGSETDGWTRSKARAALEERLTDVRREGLRRPACVTVADVAREWVAVYPTTRSLKRSTANGYASMVEHYVVPYLGHLPIDALDVAVLDRFVADRLANGLAPATVNRQLNVLSLIVRSARKRKLLRDNPVELVDRPREQRRRWRILTPAEVGRVQAAFVRIAAEADDDGERAWVEQAGTVFALVYGLGLRRGEVLGLRWRHVRLADPEGRRCPSKKRSCATASTRRRAARRRALSRSAASSPKRSSSTARARPTTPTMTACSATSTPAGRSTTSATPTPSAPRSSSPKSTAPCGRSTTAGTRR